MRLIIPLYLALTASAALAQEDHWHSMSGAQISETLTDQRVQYETAWQEFRASGKTLYNAGRDSWGYWAVRGDQYCSLWPPQDIWACYDMEGKAGHIRFIGPLGEITEGAFVD
ncbi:hypothetical protein [Sulfitobacter donghicola]|uniref:Uncharacterized protein n=1 Tax=Sulfitobacter donghicola DSW-25 = KCTC 12864 = JCM 14565 TaxID=1300350 RepID=A0A073IKM7_9RHOB|nr:hypothetical protein [Sulfitobacter donghicola]KEJ90120.1 hypothetical protein DSW25_07935 [Sulfitobacter donghicola DSW-25 = KCTC 12864 = JCM 14565]KIN66726.1 hypothetical protein Z948_429 [Sulfitobacter donghicola DSW-25 = KCTC 12864 = JCM 14565]